MAKKVEETFIDIDMDAVMEDTMSPTPVAASEIPATPVAKKAAKAVDIEGNPLINCLRNQRVIVRHIPKNTGLVQNEKHVLGGGMAEDAVRYFTVPVLRNGSYVDVLTKSEKTYLEYAMGLEIDALSIYKTKDNYWSNRMVRLTKQDTYLDLSNPSQYIDYKILLANKNHICPSLEELNQRRKATYEFVLIEEGAEEKSSAVKINATMECYVEYGKIKDDYDRLRVVIETIDGRPTSSNTKLAFLQERAYKNINANPKAFLEVVKDPMLDTKVIIHKSLEAGLIYKRGDFYYLREDNSPLCGKNEEPTLPIAAKFLNLPKNQELRFALEAKLKTV